MTNPLPWWRTDDYVVEDHMPEAFFDHAGPKGVALVRAWQDGKTDAGWGLTPKGNMPGFMENYNRKRFRFQPVVFGFEHGRWNYAFIMRALKLVCIDIDGKNGGFQHAGRLGMLPRTLAETSKSGNGYHLFYATSEDVWDETKGFAQFQDRIGLEQGVDLRAVGCVYHHPPQRWNSEPIAELPPHLKLRLTTKIQKAEATAAAITQTLETGEPEEVLLMHDNLLSDLKKPIPAGRRNNTLFALGSQMQLAQVPDWEKHLAHRATQVGLGSEETDKLIANIQKYGETP